MTDRRWRHGLRDGRWTPVQRQQNVLPLDAARNEGRFLGTILMPSSLSTLQRIGTIVLAFPFLLLGLIGLAFVLSHPSELPFKDSLHPIVGTMLNVFLDLVSLAILLVSLLAGLRMMGNVIKAGRAK
jgi:hypothetical protein